MNGIMKYVVLQTGGKQYKVSEGSEIEVEKLTASDEGVQFENVLLFAEDGKFQVGQPLLNGITVKASILEQKKGDKIRVAKFKAKSRYRKVTGHRQSLTRVRIDKIVSGKESKLAKESKEKK